MSSIQGRDYDRLRQYGSGRILSDFKLDRVKFASSVLAQHDDPTLGVVFRDSSLRNCSFTACTMAGVRVENVTVEGLKASRSSISGCVFRNVVLRGKIGHFMIAGPAMTLPYDVFSKFSQAMVDFYSDVDWALDIRDATLTGTSLRAVPGELILRDVDRHFLLHRSTRDEVEARADAPVYAKACFSEFDFTPFDTMVAVASQGSKSFATQLATLQWLRTEGFAE